MIINYYTVLVTITNEYNYVKYNDTSHLLRNENSHLNICSGYRRSEKQLLLDNST